jgi:hypothetical protein
MRLQFQLSSNTHVVPFDYQHTSLFYLASYFTRDSIMTSLVGHQNFCKLRVSLFIVPAKLKILQELKHYRLIDGQIIALIVPFRKAHLVI